MQSESRQTTQNIQPVHTFADDVAIARTYQHDTEVAHQVTPVTITVKKTHLRPTDEPIVQLSDRGAKEYLNTDSTPRDTVNVTTSTIPPAGIVSQQESAPPTPVTVLVETDTQLAKEIATVAKRPKKHSLLSDTDTIHDASVGVDLPTGTIIQDKKRHRSSIIATLNKTVRELFTAHTADQNVKVAQTVQSPIPVAVVPPQPATPSVRPPAEASVVPEEAINTAKDDFNTVVETRQRKLTPTTSSALPIIKPLTQATKESWSHYIDQETEHTPTEANKPTELPPLPTKQPVTETLIPATRIAVAPVISKPLPTISDTVVKESTPPVQPIATTKPTETPPVANPITPTPTVTPEQVVAPAPISPATPLQPASPAEAMMTPAPVITGTQTATTPTSTPPTPHKLVIASTPAPATTMIDTPSQQAQESAPLIPAPPTPVPPMQPTPVAQPTETPPAPTEPAPIIAEPEPIIPIGEFAVTEQVYEPERESSIPVTRPKVRADGIRLIPLELKKQKPVSRENKLALTLTIIIVAIGLGVITTIQLFGTRTEPNYTVTKPLPPAIVAVDKKIPVALTTDRNDLLRELTSIIEQTDTLVQIYPTALSSRDREEPASATTILSTLSPRISGPFARTITDIGFGGTESAQPFIILHVKEFDTAFAGMIEWEKMMSADLVPLFGEAVSQSYNTQARSAEGLLPASFADTIISNRSSRILFDATGVERITYTFVNQNTILITTTRTALEQLIPFVR